MVDRLTAGVGDSGRDAVGVRVGDSVGRGMLVWMITGPHVGSAPTAVVGDRVVGEIAKVRVGGSRVPSPKTVGLVMGPMMRAGVPLRIRAGEGLAKALSEVGLRLLFGSLPQALRLSANSTRNRLTGTNFLMVPSHAR